jgi:hypothetical protein
LGANFDRADALAKLQALAEQYHAELKDNGGGLRNGCEYDSYVLVGDKKYYASIAIRNPKSDRPPYFAITRMANGRKVIDDQIPLSEWGLAGQFFATCVAIARMGDMARTIGLIDRRDQLWTDDPPAAR